MGKLSHMLFLTTVLAFFQAGNVSAACTYSEAIMAMERGNQVRAMALMKMAARDGDQRAERMLNRWSRQNETLATANGNSEELEKNNFQRLVMDTATEKTEGTN